MYHEEKVIDGVLCHRSTPTGVWMKYSAEAITAKLMDSWKDVADYRKIIIPEIN